MRSIDAERARINEDRARLEAGFLAEDAECYKKFAVNSCLGKVNDRRREVMGRPAPAGAVCSMTRSAASGAQSKSARLKKNRHLRSSRKLQTSGPKPRKITSLALSGKRRKPRNRAAAKAGEQGNSDASAARLKGSQEKSQDQTRQAGHGGGRGQKIQRPSEGSAGAQGPARARTPEADQTRRRSPCLCPSKRSGFGCSRLKPAARA
jgi:colicin import membrane protein